MTRAELVGREREVGALQECFEAALEGQPGVVLCRGEPGIGKTRLAEELVTLARRRGVPAAWGRAIDSAGAPPYWPWRQVLRALGDVVDLPVIADEKRLTVDLARLAPEVFSRSTEPDGDPGSKEDRFRQFDAVGRLLRQLALADGLVIVLDDAHWADQASLLLLHHVARTVNDERLLLMVNYRDTEQVHGGLVAELAGEPVAKQIQLRGLAPPAVARQLASVVGRDVDTADVEHVHVMTGGNPFFVAEIGRTLAERADGASPSPLSPSVRDTVSARLTRLSPGCVELLEASSIVGREFPVAVVAAMTGLPVLTCLGILDEAVSGGLVEATSTPGEHRFVHALVRDAIEAHLAHRNGCGFTAGRRRLSRSCMPATSDRISSTWPATGLSPPWRAMAPGPPIGSSAPERRRCAGWPMRKRLGSLASPPMSAPISSTTSIAVTCF